MSEINKKRKNEDSKEEKRQFKRQKRSHFEFQITEIPEYDDTIETKMNNLKELPFSSNSNLHFENFEDLKYEIISKKNPKKFKVTVTGDKEEIRTWQKNILTGRASAAEHEISEEEIITKALFRFMGKRIENFRFGILKRCSCDSFANFDYDVDRLKKHIAKEHKKTFEDALITELPEEAKESKELLLYLIQIFYISFS